jgi:hypothetical protein
LLAGVIEVTFIGPVDVELPGSPEACWLPEEDDCVTAKVMPAAATAAVATPTAMTFLRDPPPARAWPPGLPPPPDSLPEPLSELLPDPPSAGCLPGRPTPNTPIPRPDGTTGCHSFVCSVCAPF